jgi:hypothetical protein
MSSRNGSRHESPAAFLSKRLMDILTWIVLRKGGIRETEFLTIRTEFAEEAELANEISVGPAEEPSSQKANQQGFHGHSQQRVPSDSAPPPNVRSIS